MQRELNHSIWSGHSWHVWLLGPYSLFVMLLPVVLSLASLPFSALAQHQQHHESRQSPTTEPKRPGGGGMGMGMGGNQPADMQTIHALFDHHQQIKRSVKPLPNGVEAVTESDDPKVQMLIQAHTWAMKARLKNHQPIRQWDPLFAALFEHADKISLEVSNTPKGVKIVETSRDPYVVKLLHAHAASISEHVKEGMPSMHKRHEVPAPDAKTPDAKHGVGTASGEQSHDHHATPAANGGSANKFLGKGDGVTTCPVTGEPVDRNVSAQIKGRTVYFCCSGCRAAVVKNPELYLKEQQMQTSAFKVLNLQPELGEGKERQVELLFEGAKRKVQQITLRNSAILAAHKAPEPITIQCVAGTGKLRLVEQNQMIDLRPGVLVTLEPNVIHEVEAHPAVSLLLTRFTSE